MKPAGVKTLDWCRYNALFFMEHILGYALFQKYYGSTQKDLYAKMSIYLTPPAKTFEVENIDKNISREEFMRRCYAPVLPKVFRGAAKDWDATKEWNLNFFEENHGHKQITLNDNVGLAKQTYEKMDLKYYIGQIKTGSLKYLRFSDIVNEDESLKNSFDLAWLRKFNIPLSWGEDLKMFMGGSDTVTPLHVGFSGFLFVQIMGKKKWILYPPSNRIFLDPRTERTFYYYSNANPHDKNDTKFPLLKYAEQYEVTLEPGDVLWVPPFTWHYVENTTNSIGIRYGRTNLASAFKSTKMLTSLIFLATKPTIFEHYYFSRTQKKMHIFEKSQSELGKSFFEKINPFRKIKTQN